MPLNTPKTTHNEAHSEAGYGAMTWQQRREKDSAARSKKKSTVLHIALTHGAGFRPPGLTSQALRCSINLAASRVRHQEPK
jgi:hypothetical protein